MPASSSRLLWADAAKGLAIMCIVLGHTIQGVNTAFGLPQDVISSVSYYAIGAFTIPLFFFVSALFIGSSLELSWPDYLKKKVAPLLYLYLVWSLIQWASRLAMGGHTNNQISPDAILHIFWHPVNTVWFIYALIWFMVLLKGLRKVPPILLGVIAGLLFALDLSSVSEFFDRVLRYFPYFLAGHFAKDFCLETLGRLAKKWAAGAVLIILFGGISYGGLQAGVGRPPLLEMSVAVLGGVSTLWVMQRLGASALARGFAFVGQRSLAIFLMHFLPAAGLRIVLTKLGVADLIGPYMVLLLAWVAGVGAPLALYELSARFKKGEWLFALPVGLLRRTP